MVCIHALPVSTTQNMPNTSTAARFNSINDQTDVHHSKFEHIHDETKRARPNMGAHLFEHCSENTARDVESDMVGLV